MNREDKDRGELLSEIARLKAEVERLKSPSKDFDTEHVELNESETRYRNLVELATDAIFMGNSQGNIISANLSAVTLTGYSLEELLGKNLGTLFSEEEHEKTPLRYDLLKAGKIIQNERMLTRKDGSLVPIGMNSRMMPDGTYHTFMRDYQERKALEDKYRRLSTLTSDYVHCCTRTGKAPFQVQWVDGAVNSVSGYCIEDVITFGCFIPLVHPEDRETVNDYLLSLVPGDSKSIEFRIVTQQHGIRWVHEQSYCEVGKSEGEVVLLGAVTDISERKKAEALIKESNEELDAFVHTVAHDLRTPLTPIIGYAEILRENYKEQLDEQGLSYLAEIEKAGTEMLALMEGLLSLAKSGTIKRPIKFVSTDKVVARIIKNLKPNISAAGAILQINPLPPIHIPKAFLTQIFDNLIGNALRYAGNSGDLIEVGGEQAGKQIRFFVRDHGLGIFEQERKHIFEIFYRGTNKGEVQGSGIGLAIVYKIARNYGGRAWVEETPGGGCTFWVEVEDVAQT